MRFLELHFPAFGPFTDFRLQFAEESGLHLIYGPNESGKSSALRAVRGLLYGIPGDGKDEFLHPGDSLRLKALLQHSSGERLALGRRKGRGKKTLLDEEGKPCQGDPLERFLGGVDADLFDRLYGLDHRTLSEGGKALLEEGGKVGESLFAAGLGPGFLQARDSLREDAEKLWRPKSRTLELDRAIEAYRAASKRAAELSVSAESWRKLSTELAEEGEKAADLDREIRRLDAEKQRLSRFLDAHVPWTARQHLKAELAELAGLPELALDFPERRQGLQSVLLALRAQLARVKESEVALAARKSELPAESPLLRFASRIERLHRSLDAVAEAEAKLPVNKVRAEVIARRLRALASDLGLSGEPSAWTSLPDAPTRARARRLAERYRRLVEERSACEEQLGALQRRQRAVAREMEELGPERDTAELEAALRRLRKSLGQDNDVASAEAALAARSTALTTALSALPQWSGTIEELAALRVPDAHQLAEHERQDEQARRQLKKVEDEREQLETKGKRDHEKLARLRDRDKVRTRADLGLARSSRDEIWLQLLAEGGASRKLQSAMEKAMREADVLADRLLDDAARVAEVERLAAELHAGRQEWVEATRHRKELMTELEGVQKGWRELWNCPRLTLGTVAEMRAWLARRESVLALLAEVKGLKERAAEARRLREAELESLTRQWPELSGRGHTIAQAIEVVEATLLPLQKVAEQRRALSREETQLLSALAEAEAVGARAEAGLRSWREEWSQLALAFHRDAKADPQDLESLLERYEELRGMLDDAERADRELAEQTAESQSFRQQMMELAADLQEQPPEADLSGWVQRLVEALAESRRLHTVRQQLLEQLETLSRERQETERALAQKEAEWSELLKEAGRTGGLPELEADVARRRQVTERLRDLESTLRPLCGGLDIEEFSQILAEIDWDTVPGQIRDLERTIATLELERSETWHRKGQLEQALRAFDGAEAAAEAAQEAAEAMAEGKAVVARYASLTLAEAVLRREMERYRREHEAPVLRAASVWFNRLTRQAYSGLTGGLDPRTDQPRLEAVSASGRHVPVEGLSDGTRDQLFLALRLATIELTLDTAEPIPMVMDDVLVHFDTERARATLQVLSEFAQRNQVLLFTHLDRDRELAQALAAEGGAQVLDLDPIGL